MSTTPETEFNLEMHFLPAWAKESPTVNRYAKFEGESERSFDRKRDRRDGPGRRPGGPRPGGPGGPGRDAGGFRGRSGPGGGPGGPGGPGAGARAGDRRGPDRRGGGRPGGPGGQGGSGGPRPEEPRELPLPEVNVSFIPDDIGVDSLARQIRVTGRAYPLFDIAQMVLAKPERHQVAFSVKRRPDNTLVQPMFSCALDDSLWLSEDEAIRHALEKHFATFYQPEKIQIDPPKGVYTFVAQCGMSGVILGPPNYHDYQNQLRRVHAERFSRMPFEMFKARVKIVKDEAVVKSWVEEQSWKTEFVCLNVPEPLKLGSREEVEKHFREVHLSTIVKPVETFRTSGVQSRNIRDRGLARLVRQRWEEQKRFPIQVATVLSQQFASKGLQFFKVNKTVTHVAVARPHFLDLEATPVSDGIRQIVEYINSHPRCTHKALLDALAPRPAAAPAVPPAEGAAATPATPAASEPSPEQTRVMTDLHWLIHQGHVIEFASGVLETAKRPLPKPVKPPKAPSPAAAAAAPAAPTTPVTTGAEPTATGSAPVEAVASEPAADAGSEAPTPAAAPTVAAPEAAPAEVPPANPESQA